MQEQVKNILSNVFGYNEFKPLQQDIIVSVLQKKDALILMPTGGGKSLCYQIPALIFEGLTVVVSPLISLMKDQVDQLTALGVEAALLNSTLAPDLYRRNVERIKRGEVKLLYLAPEALLKANMLALLSACRVDCLAIDEAHCISEWGHDFRPEYRQLANVRLQFPEAVCLALTATATPRVQEDIVSSLNFEASNAFVASFNRENLFVEIVPKREPETQTIEFLKKFPDQSGIIYCFSRKQVDTLYELLDSQGFSVKPYHAGLNETLRTQNQELFIRDDVQIIVATVAFGMGINKPNVRFVVHYDLPKNIETYYQEIGRAGRDGLKAHCLLLFSYGDIQKIKYFISQMSSEREQLAATIHLDALLGLIETNVCRRIPMLNYFGETFSATSCGMCDNCVNEPEPLEDITVAAQKFLSCVKRTGELFGANHIVDVLRGSESQRVLKFRHHLLSTHGIGKEFSKRQWLHLSRQFVQKGLLTQDLQYGSLKLSEKAYEVLRSQAVVMGQIEQDRVKFSRPKTVELDYDQELFTTLREKRKALADAANVPPYVIFPDKTLIEMAVYYPQSSESFLALHGVGAAKAKRFAEIFLSIISDYCATHRIEAKINPNTPTTQKSQSGKTQKHVVVGEAFNDGIPVQDIMAKHAIKQSTVLGHLYTYFREGHTLRAAELLELSTLSSAERSKVFDAFDRLGTEYLRPVYDACNEQINYDELRILQLHYLSSP